MYQRLMQNQYIKLNTFREKLSQKGSLERFIPLSLTVTPVQQDGFVQIYNRKSRCLPFANRKYNAVIDAVCQIIWFVVGKMNSKCFSAAQRLGRS